MTFHATLQMGETESLKNSQRAQLLSIQAARSCCPSSWSMKVLTFPCQGRRIHSTSLTIISPNRNRRPAPRSTLEQLMNTSVCQALRKVQRKAKRLPLFSKHLTSNAWVRAHEYTWKQQQGQSKSTYMLDPYSVQRHLLMLCNWQNYKKRRMQRSDGLLSAEGVRKVFSGII